MTLATDPKGMHRPTEPAVPDSCSLSIILCTQGYADKGFFKLADLKNLIPEGISNEIILVRYNQSQTEYSERIVNKQDSSQEKTAESEMKEDNTKILQIVSGGKFSPSVIKALKSSSGQFILVIDADFPYPGKMIPTIVTQIKNQPNSIVIALKYARHKSVTNVPFIRSKISKVSRLAVKHGLRVKKYQGPTFQLFCNSLRTDKKNTYRRNRR